VNGNADTLVATMSTAVCMISRGVEEIKVAARLGSPGRFPTVYDFVVFAQLARGASPNDYPTEARADYVFACMQVNGQTRDSLMKCSCSIDAIAAVLPYRVPVGSNNYDDEEEYQSVS
jgi:hypothetical protein